MDILQKVEQLIAELDNMRPLDVEVEARIMQKLRLDWNYHSNKLEGNTYSYGETRMLLMKELTAGGKPKRDAEEITGHDQAITFIIDSIKVDEPLTEGFIRHLHKLILVRPFWGDAKTADGQPTKRLIKVGEYKTEPNHVEMRSGRKFRFAEPIETPAKMQELVEWFRDKSEQSETNTLLLAAELHYKFVRIHPFDDGNGRLSRLLMNFVLMRSGYPPVIIKNEDKDNYIAVLEQADFNILEPFVNYVAQNLAHSLELMIRGAKGENIEEPEDIDKELTLIEKRLKVAERKIAASRVDDLAKDKEILRRIITRSFEPLANLFCDNARKFGQFYKSSSLRIELNFSPDLQGNNLEQMIRSLLENVDTGSSKLSLKYEFGHFLLEDIVRDKVSFRFISAIVFRFRDYNTYEIIVGEPESYDARKQLKLEKDYLEDLDSQEIDRLVRFEMNRHKERLKYTTEYYESLGLTDK